MLFNTVGGGRRGRWRTMTLVGVAVLGLALASGHAAGGQAPASTGVVGSVAVEATTIVGPSTSVKAQKLAAPSRVGAKSKKDDPWNVVLVLTDDQPKGQLDAMPNVNRKLAARGVTYPNAYVATSVCCPSRASLLTGDLAAETGVYSNDGGVPYGGFGAFKRNGNEKRTFAVSLRKAGYQTGYFGKYMNAYGAYYKGRAPRGWDTWLAFATKNRSGAYSRYPVTQPYSKADRKRIAKGTRPKSKKSKVIRRYSTNYFGQQTNRFIRKADADRPVLAVFAPYAPHANYKAQVKYRNSLADTGWWRTDPSFQEADVSDKPQWVQDRQPDLVPAQELIDDQRKQREALRSVDDQVGKLLKTLRKTKRLNRTVFIFASDNGYTHGQHGLRGKYTPYRVATEVPLIVRYGKQDRAARTDSRVVAANIDLTATILQSAGVKKSIEGRSLTTRPRRTGIPLTGVEAQGRPGYCGWRTRDEMFVRYSTGEEEYYDYRSDSYELENRAADPAAAGSVAPLRSAAAAACQPAPPGYGASFDQPAGPSPT